MKKAKKYLEVTKEQEVIDFEPTWIVSEKDAMNAIVLSYNEAIEDITDKISTYTELVSDQRAVLYLLQLVRDLKKLKK